MSRKNSIEISAARYHELMVRNRAAQTWRDLPSPPPAESARLESVYEAGKARVAGKPPKPRKSKPRKASKPLRVPEKAVLRACSDVLANCPFARLWWRQNTGAMQKGSRYIEFSFKGASDLMAVLAGGRFLAVECKATGKTASPEQAAFLDNVRDAGGFAVCVDSAAALSDYLRIIAAQ